VHQLLKNTSFALADYNVYLNANPNDHEAHFARGKILLQENDTKQAIIDISYYTSVIKTNEDAYLALFFAHKQLGDSKEALNMIDSAIDNKPLSSKLNKIKADYLFDLNRFEEASNSYDKAIASHRSNASLYVSKAEAKYKLGLFNDAAESMDKALQYGGENATYYYDKAFYLLQGKRYLESKVAIQKSIELNYEDSATAYFILAVNFNNLGYAEDACLNFKKAYELGNKEAKEYVAKLCD
jgi:tetratricopeptide (TPR) repeat protein